MRVPRILSGIEGGTAASTKAMGPTSFRSHFRDNWKVSGARLMPLSGTGRIWNRRKGEILDSIYGSMESISFSLHSTKKNLLERIHGIERAKKLIFLPLYRKTLRSNESSEVSNRLSTTMVSICV